MKRSFVLLFTLIIIFSFSACEKKEKIIVNNVEKKPNELIAEGNYLDAYNALIKIGDAASKKELEKFFFLPEQSIETDNLGMSVTYDYLWDDHGKPLEIIFTSADTTHKTEYLYGEGNFSYMFDGEIQETSMLDDSGNIVFCKYYTSSNSFNTMDYSYDDNGRLIKTSEVIEGYYDSPDVITYSYNKNGNISTISSDSTLKEFTYDIRGRLIMAVENISSKNIYYETVYSYNDKSQIIKSTKTKINSDSTKEFVCETSYTYNKEGKPECMTKIYLDENDEKIQYKYDWSYDEYGNMIKQVYTFSYKNIKEVSTIEHINYNIYYAPEKHAVLNDVIKGLQPDLKLYND